jgi:hypothetical protein
MAFIPRYVRKNIVRGQAALWIAPYSVTEPLVLPADTEPLGFDWADAVAGDPLWTPLGASESGATMRFTRETTDISIEEQVNPVDVAVNTLDPRIEITLSEDSLETMRIAYGGGEITTTAPTATEPGIRELNVTQDLEHFTLGLEAENSDKFWRRVLLLDVLSVAEVETSYRRAESQRLYACSFRLISPIEDLVIREMNLPPTGP